MLKVFCGTVSIVMAWKKVNNHKRFWKQQQFRYQSLSVHLLLVYSNIVTSRNPQILSVAINTPICCCSHVLIMVFLGNNRRWDDFFRYNLLEMVQQRCKDVQSYNDRYKLWVCVYLHFMVHLKFWYEIYLLDFHIVYMNVSTSKIIIGITNYYIIRDEHICWSYSGLMQCIIIWDKHFVAWERKNILANLHKYEH